MTSQDYSPNGHGAHARIRHNGGTDGQGRCQEPQNGALNPNAHMQKEVTMDEVLKSRLVSWPLKLYDCSLITDGASVVILTKPKLAKKLSDNYVHISDWSVLRTLSACTRGRA